MQNATRSCSSFRIKALIQLVTCCFTSLLMVYTLLLPTSVLWRPVTLIIPFFTTGKPAQWTFSHTPLYVFIFHSYLRYQSRNSLQNDILFFPGSAISDCINRTYIFPISDQPFFGLCVPGSISKQIPYLELFSVDQVIRFSCVFKRY